jgi:hypothetical protein
MELASWMYGLEFAQIYCSAIPQNSLKRQNQQGFGSTKV